MECPRYAFPAASGECFCWPGFVKQPDGKCEAPEFLPHCALKTPFSERQCRFFQCNKGYVPFGYACLPECDPQCEGLDICYNGRCVSCLRGQVANQIAQVCDSLSFCVDSDGKSCVACASQYYLAADGTCVSCPPGCYSCFSQTTCLVCETGFELVMRNEKGIAFALCEQREEAVAESDVSDASIENCAIQTGDLCQECQKGFLLTIERKRCAITDCGTGKFASEEGCVQIPEFSSWLKGFECIEKDADGQNCATACDGQQCQSLLCEVGYKQEAFLVDDQVVWLCVVDVGETNSQAPKCDAEQFLKQDVENELSCEKCPTDYLAVQSGAICVPAKQCQGKTLFGCSQCGDGQSCMKCSKGYILSPQHQACASDQMTNCFAYRWQDNRQYACSTCNSGAVLSYDATRCWPLVTSLTGSDCTRLEGDQCTRCYQDKVLDAFTNDCVDQIAGCDVHFATQQCARCRPGYFIGSSIGSQECIPCAAGQSGDGIACSAPEPCAVAFGCVACDSYGSCAQCAVGMKLTNDGGCVWLDECATIDQCVQCEQKDWCSFCQTGQAFDGSACRRGLACAGTFISECIICAEAGCKECAFGFGLNSYGQCQPCGQRCQHCSADTCLICEPRYGVFEGRCVECAQQCATCTAVEHCLSCVSGVLPKQGSCECATGCTKCLVALDDTSCLACSPSYLLDAGGCTDNCVGGSNLPTLDGLKCGKCGDIYYCAACKNERLEECAACVFGHRLLKDKCEPDLPLICLLSAGGVFGLALIIVFLYFLIKKIGNLKRWNRILIKYEQYRGGPYAPRRNPNTCWRRFVNWISCK